MRPGTRGCASSRFQSACTNAAASASRSAGAASRRSVISRVTCRSGGGSSDLTARLAGRADPLPDLPRALRRVRQADLRPRVLRSASPGSLSMRLPRSASAPATRASPSSSENGSTGRKNGRGRVDGDGGDRRRRALSPPGGLSSRSSPGPRGRRSFRSSPQPGSESCSPRLLGIYVRSGGRTRRATYWRSQRSAPLRGDALVFEDTEAGIASARAAGTRVVALLGTQKREKGQRPIGRDDRHPVAPALAGMTWTIAHGGASAELPENTLPAFERAKNELPALVLSSSTSTRPGRAPRRLPRPAQVREPAPGRRWSSSARGGSA